MSQPDVLELMAREIAQFPRDVSGLPVAPQVSPAEIRAYLGERYGFDAPLPLEAILTDVMSMLRQWTLHCTHPRYFGLFNPSVHEAGVWADALVALYNPQVGAWAHAPAATEIERHVLMFLMRTLGLSEHDTTAHLTSGGSEANQTAVIAALAHRYPNFVEDGVSHLDEQPTLYLSSEAHHSFEKAVRVAGLGQRALRYVPTDARLRMNTDALRAMIRADRDHGRAAFLVVGTAGTTAAGAVDDLSRTADVAREAGAWFHVDAAWGGTAALSPRLRDLLVGVERADSITWDAHKWLSVPMGAGMFFCKHPAVLRRAFGVTASYVPQETEQDTWGDLYLGSLQWSRRFIGLKVFLTLASLGASGMRDLVEHQADMGELLRTQLRMAGWDVVNDTRLPVVCFTHPNISRGDISAREIAALVCGRGRAWISEAVIGEQVSVLRACITSFRTAGDDIEVLIEELDAALPNGSR